MRRLLASAPWAFLLLSTVFPAPVLSAEYPSRVDRVVLYPDLVEVTRVVEVERPDAAVVLPGLTPALLADTLAVRVLGGDVGIAGVSAEDVFRTEPVDARVSELTRRIEELSDGKRRAEESAAAGRREKDLLERGILAIYAAGTDAKVGEKGSPPRLSVTEVEAALSLYRARVEALDGKVFETERAARDLEKKITAARQELEKIRTPRPTQEKRVHVDLARAGKCRLAVSYLVPAAGFVPRYNARLVPATGALLLELVAEAWQRTGEDWKEATFAFSTARPGRMAQLPTLPPWELDFPQPTAVRPMMKMRMTDEVLPMAAPAETESKEAGAPEPVKRFASFEVTLPGTNDLGGKGEKKSFPLARQEQGTNVVWRAVPKTADGAFVAADGRNETGLPVFAAPAGLFLEDAFVGRGSLPDIPEGEEFRIDFGKDPSVQVKRKELMRRREDGGVFQKVKRVRFRYGIEARNFRKEAVPLTVLDQVPVPRHKDIVVKDVEITGGGTAGDRGEVKWEITLAPGQKISLELSFTVEYPADREIHGL